MNDKKKKKRKKKKDNHTFYFSCILHVDIFYESVWVIKIIGLLMWNY